jgi:putative transposase
VKHIPIIHYRKSIRLKEYDYSSPGEYFITICTNGRDCILGEIVDEKMRLSTIGDVVKKYWEEIPKYYQDIEIDEFIIMPNHIHGIIVLTEPVGAIHESPLPTTAQQRRKMKLSKIIGRFKMKAAKEINLQRSMAGISVWQRGYYEHVIRSEKELNNIRDYIINNPIKWVSDEENTS